ncbi:hypothetical protein [Natronocalculus amylovorans]|uniref:DUF7999 domain-containing protein n=1 Tax=Natronocalculus amylovorans TaxID=2917812 RepID=A0AAE3K930_9EURY|nr:hypothetical protein [Natronocalculus amylovorans]MCL9817120.1 hypothetical protein [Natronocalculus amylovorans]NUE02853.1 hypothetical protein [Halorubraceae archaeon YAN]
METNATFRVLAEQNNHGALTVEHPNDNATFHVVSYANEGVKRAAQSLQPGSTVEMTLSRAGVRSNVWQAESVTRTETDTTF